MSFGLLPLVDDFLIYFGNLMGDTLYVEQGLSAATRLATKTPPQRGIGEQGVAGVGKGLGVSRGNDNTRLAVLIYITSAG